MIIIWERSLTKCDELQDLRREQGKGKKKKWIQNPLLGWNENLEKKIISYYNCYAFSFSSTTVFSNFVQNF